MALQLGYRRAYIHGLTESQYRQPAPLANHLLGYVE